METGWGVAIPPKKASEAQNGKLASTVQNEKFIFFVGVAKPEASGGHGGQGRR